VVYERSKSVEHWWYDVDVGEQKNSEKKLFYNRLDQYTSQMNWLGIENWLSWLEAGD
jgi:hypothetical protein